MIVDHCGQATRGAGEVIVQLDFMIINGGVNHSVTSFWELRWHLRFSSLIQVKDCVLHEVVALIGVQERFKFP